MTECERLVAEGTFDKSFFEEEVRCEFLVDTLRKKIWAIELDLLLQLDKVCRKYNLHYVLWAGTLLGAARHKGFIPWDDDMDVAMLREDYEKLLSHADEFAAPYFLQNTNTDPEAGYSHAKIRNSNTTAWNKLWGYRDYNYGIYIDVFPFDDLVLEGRKERLLEAEELSVKNSLWMKSPSPYKNAWDEMRINTLGEVDIVKNYNRIQELCTCVGVGKSEKVALSYKKVRKIENGYPRSLFTNVMYAPYEQYSFPIPVDYESYLVYAYGDWRQFPPVEKRVNKHWHTIFDPDTPYKEFVRPPFEPDPDYVKFGLDTVEKQKSLSSNIS